MDSAFISRSCTNLCSCKGSQVEAKVQSPTSHSCVPACKKLDGVATWLINGVATVFFTSLERCSCIIIDTKDGPDDSIYLPLIFYDGCSKEAKGKKGTGTEERTKDDYIDNNMVVKDT